MLAYSVVLVLVMIFRPQGIFGSWEFSLPRVVNRLLFRNKATKAGKPGAPGTLGVPAKQAGAQAKPQATSSKEA